MTAVAAAPTMSNRDSGNEPQTEHSPSRFTAVNGKDSVVSGPNAGDPVPSSDPVNREEQGAQPGDRDTQEISRETHAGGLDGQSRRSSTFTHTHKRRRSESGEQGSRVSDGSERESTNRPTPAPPTSNGAVSGSASSEAEPSHIGIATASLSERPVPVVASQPPPNGSWPEYESQLISQAQRAQQIDASDAHLADALQRETDGQEPRALNRPIQSAPGIQSPSSPAYNSERSATAVQVAPKRKRVFSNRTKTGCMTCRRRKKKCDELHPACNNCLRGGFVCGGYTPRTTWSRPNNPKGPPTLQSKEGYPEISGQYPADASQHHDRQSGVTGPIESRRMNPVAADDSERCSQHYSASPTGTNSSQASWTQRAWPGGGRTTYSEHPIANADYREIHPIQDLPREGGPQHGYTVVPPIRELHRGPPSNPTMSLFQSGVEHRSLPTATLDTGSPQSQARMAPSIEHQRASRILLGDNTEMAKMIRGEPYRPFDVDLREERDRCKGALWRFNNACSPLSGLTFKEQARLLRAILNPQLDSLDNSSNTAGRHPTGSIGQDSVVEAPFHCHYGWHITIGTDVMISRNCSFVDDCGIEIGANTWIGPNVTLLSAMASRNLQERKGPQTRYHGEKIIIEQDCYIGAGSTILPGVTIGRGSVIDPGEVVGSNVPQYRPTKIFPNYMS